MMARVLRGPRRKMAWRYLGPQFGDLHARRVSARFGESPPLSGDEEIRYQHLHKRIQAREMGQMFLGLWRMRNTRRGFEVMAEHIDAVLGEIGL